VVNSIVILSSGTTAPVGISGLVIIGTAISIAKIIGIIPTINTADLTMVFLDKFQNMIIANKSW
jgi:hypothetical protein